MTLLVKDANSTITSLKTSTVDGELVAHHVIQSGSVNVFQSAHDNLNANANIQVGNVDVSVSNPIPISGNSTFNTKEINSSNSSISSVTATGTNVTILASNSNRLGASIYNESTASTLYLKLGATASYQSFTVKMARDTYYEVPYKYTGIIEGIWTASATGYARITEFTV